MMSHRTWAERGVRFIQRGEEAQEQKEVSACVKAQRQAELWEEMPWRELWEDQAVRLKSVLWSPQSPLNSR